MTTTDSQPAQTGIFESLASHADSPDQMLEKTIGHLRESRRAIELFEAMKMRVRHQLGLSLINHENDPAPDEQVERQLEAGLLDACREAGAMLIADGRVGEGWMYLRPLGDLDFAKRELSSVEINDENYDEMVQVLLHEGVDVARGYGAILKQQGTCNAITLFEQAIVGRSKTDRQAAAAELLEHFYEELSTMVREDIAGRDKENPEALNQDGRPQTLGEMVQTRVWLLAEGGYHLDTTHIAATVRIASVLEDREAWKKARDLTLYGRKLNHQFQYPGDEPFADFYPSFGAFYDVLLGQHVDAGLKLFERKARSVDVAEHGTGAIEAYVDLLDRTGQGAKAVQIAAELVPKDVPAQQIVPMLIEIATRSGDPAAFDPILEYCRGHEDVLGYTAVMHAKGRLNA